MLTKNQAKEWGVDGIRANAICPGLVKRSSVLQYGKMIISLDKWKKVSRLVVWQCQMKWQELAVFLASSASSYCTGSVFTADGGHMIAG